MEKNSFLNNDVAQTGHPSQKHLNGSISVDSHIHQFRMNLYIKPRVLKLIEENIWRCKNRQECSDKKLNSIGNNTLLKAISKITFN